MAFHKFSCCSIPLALVLGLTGCQRQDLAESHAAIDASAFEPKYETVIRQPPVPSGVQGTTPTGAPVALQCRSCHDVLSPDRESAKYIDLKEFHQGLKVVHGRLSCVSCHNPDDGYESLRLADGQSVPFAESMTLCGQCHGPQLRDYNHGVHGGMVGYWDLSRGPRERNHCLHCHDAHSPRYPHFDPVAPPLDRFAPVTPESHAASDNEGNES